MAITFGNEITVQLHSMECGECGSVFAMSEDFYERCKEKGLTFYCPRGHARVFTKSENSKLREEINNLENRLINAQNYITEKNHRIEQLRYSIRAEKAAKTKILNRVKNGVCPCCNRSFSNLQNHFKIKHPELLQK